MTIKEVSNPLEEKPPIFLSKHVSPIVEVKKNNSTNDPVIAQLEMILSGNTLSVNQIANKFKEKTGSAFSSLKRGNLKKFLERHKEFFSVSQDCFTLKWRDHSDALNRRAMELQPGEKREKN